MHYIIKHMCAHAHGVRMGHFNSLLLPGPCSCGKVSEMGESISIQAKVHHLLYVRVISTP